MQHEVCTPCPCFSIVGKISELYWTHSQEYFGNIFMETYFLEKNGMPPRHYSRILSWLKNPWHNSPDTHWVHAGSLQTLDTITPPHTICIPPLDQLCVTGLSEFCEGGWMEGKVEMEIDEKLVGVTPTRFSWIPSSTFYYVAIFPCRLTMAVSKLQSFEYSTGGGAKDIPPPPLLAHGRDPFPTALGVNYGGIPWSQA